jgi:hypothetical protein
MAHGDNIVIIGAIFVAVYLFVPVATLASGFLRSRGDDWAFPALVAANVALWVLLATSMGEGALGRSLSLPYLCLIILTSAIGGALRFFLPPSGAEPSCIGSMLLGFAIGVPVPLTVLGRAGLFTQPPSTGVTAVLIFLTGFLFYQACAGRSRLRLKQPFDTYGFLCLSLAATLGIATFLANFFPLAATS